MRKIICDICGNESGNYDRNIHGKFILHKKQPPSEVCEIAIEGIVMKYNFCTTGIDICRSCLIAGIKSAILD